MMNPRSPYAAMAAPAMRQPQPMGGGQSMYAPRVQNKPIQPRQAPQQTAPAKSGGGMGDMMGMAGGMMGSMMSDRHSKEEIHKLESANEALTAALSSQASYPDTTAPSPGMQALGQQPSAAPADTPAANKVAAQNVAMQPGQSDIRNPWPSAQPPNLSALDEAYKRMGRGG